MRNKPAIRREPADLADRVEFRLDPDAPPGNLIPALARLLRRLRDRERAEAADQAGEAEARDNSR